MRWTTLGIRSAAIPLIVATVIGATTAARPRTPAHSTAVEVIDSALARMGDTNALRNIKRVRFDEVVQWLTIALDDEPHADAPSYNWNSELRDYALNSTRKTRRSTFGFRSSGGAWPEWFDIVQDTVGTRRMTNGAWVAISSDYVDEQREAFAVSPERLLFAARQAPDIRLGTDTIIGSRPYVRVTGTVPALSTRPLTLFLARSDGQLRMTRFRAARPRDAALGSYGEMETEFWFSNWKSVALNKTAVVTYPMQWDIHRLRHPYQRISIIAADFNVPATPDSFIVSDSMRKVYLEGPTRDPDWTFTLRSATVAGRFAFVRRFMTPLAVLVGNQWVLLEGTQAVEARRLLNDSLTHWVPGSRIGAALVTSPTGLGVGTGWLVRKGVPVYVAPGARRAVTLVGKNWGDHEFGTVPAAARWIRLGTDSIWIEPVDLPSAPGALLLYAPSVHWLYSASANSPLQLRFLADLAKRRSWTVDSIGARTAVRMPAPGMPVGKPPGGS